MLILIDRISMRMIASAGNHKLIALVQKWDFPEADGLVVDSEIGRDWTAMTEDEMKHLYLNMSGQPAESYPGYKDAIEQLRQYAGTWPEYPKPLSYFEDLEAQQTISQPVTTEEAKAAQKFPPDAYDDSPGNPLAGLPPEDRGYAQEPDDEEDGTHFVSHRDLEQAQNHEPVSRATHQAIITGVEKANAAMTPEQKEAAKASAPTKPEKAKSAEPSAPRKPGATKQVWDIADARLAANPGMDLKTLRKLIIAECESQGINGGTAATQFGKWKAARGK